MKDNISIKKLEEQEYYAECVRKKKFPSMKVYINSAKENWVVDRFIKEWNNYNFKQSKTLIFLETN